MHVTGQQHACIETWPSIRGAPCWSAQTVSKVTMRRRASMCATDTRAVTGSPTNSGACGVHGHPASRRLHLEGHRLPEKDGPGPGQVGAHHARHDAGGHEIACKLRRAYPFISTPWTMHRPKRVVRAYASSVCSGLLSPLNVANAATCSAAALRENRCLISKYKSSKLDHDAATRACLRRTW